METVEDNELCFPHLLNASCIKVTGPYISTLFVNTVVYLISLFTVTLNLLVIVSISHYKYDTFAMLHLTLYLLLLLSLCVCGSPCRQLHTPTNLLLLSLGVLDFSVGLLMFFTAPFLIDCWPYGDTNCIVYEYVAYVVTSVSVETIVLISMDRYIAICQPLLYCAKVTVHRIRVCIGLCWLCTVLYVAVIFKGGMENPDSVSSCSGECVFILNYYEGILDVLMFFILPVGAIVALYSRVFVGVIYQVRSMRSKTTAAVTVNKSELKAAGTLGVVVVLFLICTCPYYGVMLTGQNTMLNSSSGKAARFLFYFNSCLNPIIYTFLYSWFRKCLRNLVTLQILKPGSSKTRILTDR